MEIRVDERLDIKKTVGEKASKTLNYLERYLELKRELAKRGMEINYKEEIKIMRENPFLLKITIKFQDFEKEYLFSKGSTEEDVFFRAKMISEKVFLLEYFGICWEIETTEEKKNYSKSNGKARKITKAQKNFLFRIKGEEPEKLKAEFDGDINELSQQEASSILKRLGFD